MEKKISKMQLATIKRIAQNVSSIRAKKESLDAKINKLVAERDDFAAQIEEMELPVRRITGGYTSNQIYRKVVTPKFDDQMQPVVVDGRPVKVTTYELINPETIIPTQNVAEETNYEPVDYVSTSEEMPSESAE